MKKTYFVLVALLAMSAPSASAVMGVPDGLYLGRGTIFKAGGLIQVPFSATRVIANETLTSSSVANLLGLPLVFNSRLAFAPSTRADRPFDVFSLEDMDPSNGAPMNVGAAGCGNGFCGFNATIKRGRVSMRETWVVRPDGSFAVTQGWQNAYGVEMTYQAVFYRQ